MDKLERYLDQVCRGIGGPRSLRQHVRQELREHLLDAMAEHKAAGMPEEAALERALADFGGPEQVHSELAATHGQRLLAVVIDKAMQWKERTMKARWLWTSWANLALAVVILLEAMFITFNVVFIVPKFQVLMRHGIIDSAFIDEAGTGWMTAFLQGLMIVTGGYTTFLLLGAAVAWGLFEWRVRSENKAFMRLSAFGTVAVGLLVVIILTSGSLVVSFTLGAPAVGRLVRPYAQDQVAKIDASLGTLERALAKKDWEAVTEQTNRAKEALGNLTKDAPVLPALAGWHKPPTLEELRAQVETASEALQEARQASDAKDPGRLTAALQKFHEGYDPVARAARKAER
jgi:hypothetical protein